MATNENSTEHASGPLAKIARQLAKTAQVFNSMSVVAVRVEDTSTESGKAYLMALQAMGKHGERLAAQCSTKLQGAGTVERVMNQASAEPEGMRGGSNAAASAEDIARSPNNKLAAPAEPWLTEDQAAYLASELCYGVGSILSSLNRLGKKVAETVETEDEGVAIMNLARRAEEILDDCTVRLNKHCYSARIRDRELRDAACIFNETPAGAELQP